MVEDVAEGPFWWFDSSPAEAPPSSSAANAIGIIQHIFRKICKSAATNQQARLRRKLVNNNNNYANSG
jgi:hypothetical protein